MAKEKAKEKEEKLKRNSSKAKLKDKTTENKKTKEKDNKKTKTKAKTNKNKSKKSFVAEVKAELKKVKWPAKDEMIKYSVAVIAFIVVFGLYFYGLDAFFAWISSLVKGL
jgi:preprotein translocase subunit SecE